VTTSAVRIRDATEGDVPRLVELLAQLSLDAPREAAADVLDGTYYRAFEDIQRDPRQRLLVLDAVGTVVATAVFIVVPNLSHGGRPYAILENIVVDAGERSRGHGEALLRYLMDAAREAGCYKIGFTSHNARKDAHRFYERLGFVASHHGYRMELP